PIHGPCPAGAHSGTGATSPPSSAASARPRFVGSRPATPPPATTRRTSSPGKDSCMSRPEVLRHSPQELLSVRDIEVQFTKRTGLLGMRPETFTAVGGVSLSVARGETLGLVGESGSGKSTLARGILGLTPLTAGSVGFDGHDLHALSGRELRRVQQDIQMVFQDPLASLNPRYTIGQVIAEGWRIHPATAPPRGRRRQRVGELLELVGLNPDHAERYAHEFSGGQRQRVSIARAIAMDPKLIVCDEAVSALDVSIQAQVLNLLG